MVSFHQLIATRALIVALVFLVLHVQSGCAICRPSITTVTGRRAPKGPICSGALILDEEFNKFDLTLWQHENTLGGGGVSDTSNNWEFQWNTNSRENSFVRNGNLHIRPTLTADIYGEAFLSSGRIDLNNEAADTRCTNEEFFGCNRIGTPDLYLNSVRTARINTKDTFAFKYGKIEVRAKIASGDWLSSGIWLLPKDFYYGDWPRSGHIVLMTARGNRNLRQNNREIGVQQVQSSLHFGLDYQQSQWPSSLFLSNLARGYDKEFHKYTVEWTDQNMKFFIDGRLVGSMGKRNGNASDPFWQRVSYGRVNSYNPWRKGDAMAPFDQPFYIILNESAGGLNFFPDDVDKPQTKPWKNASPTAFKDFWLAKDEWLPTWRLDQNAGQDASLLIDYVKVWAI